MVSRRNRKRAGLLAVAAAAVLYSAPATAGVDEAELRERLEIEFGASVLDIEEGQLNGEPVWLVKLMRESRRDNAAFKVDVVPVDPETGKLLRGRTPDLNPARFLRSSSTRELGRRPDAFPRRPWLRE